MEGLFKNDTKTRSLGLLGMGIRLLKDSRCMIILALDFRKQAMKEC